MMGSNDTPSGDREELGDYRLQFPIARGGMGEIWYAVDRRTGEPVAIKRLLGTEGKEIQPYRARLIREARALEQLRHPNIVRYLGSGQDSHGQPYLVMEFLEGESLAASFKRTILGLEQVLDYTQQALRGLQYCHARSVIHRDLKPENIFLVPRDGGQQVKLVDFGLVLLGGDATRLTRAGDLLGTLHYLSPEQAKSAGRVDHRTDIYAMGVFMYRLTTGRLPFQGHQPLTILLEIVTEIPERPRRLNPALPAWLEQVILKAMARNPEERFASAREMREALDRPLSDESLSFPPTLMMDRPGEVAGISEASTLGLEHRLVSLLCTKPVAADDEQEASVTAIETNGGVVHRVVSGEVLGVFGVEQTLGDEPRRAVEAGMAVREALGTRVKLLAATVHVVAGEGLHFDASGLDEITEKLDRLPPGDLFLDHVIRQLVEDHIEVKRVEGHDAVGKYSRARPSRRRVLEVETPTVGRETELAALRAAFRRAVQNKEPEAALMAGPAGIGKSRLLSELLPELREESSLCLEARAEPAKGKTPYSLLAQAVAQRAGIHLGQDVQQRRSALSNLLLRYIPAADQHSTSVFMGEAVGIPFDESPSLVAARSDPKVMRERILLAFERFLGAAAERGTVCVCLEDLHWADEESLQLCERLLDRLDRAPLFLLGTSRPELLVRRPHLLRDADAVRVDLRPLGRRVVRRLLRVILGPKILPETEDLIIDWSDGNPYFVEELITWMVGQQVLTRGEDGWYVSGDTASLDLPAGIEGVIQGRLDQLPAQLTSLLRAAAVMGETFWESACEAMGFPDAGLQLRELQTANFVTVHGESRIQSTREWRFCHALLAQVAYQKLLQDHRQPLHLKAACWLERIGETDAALLAHHFSLGGDQLQAAHYRERAAARWLADGNLQRSIDCYKAALCDGVSPSQRAERLVGLARAYCLHGQYERAWQSLDQVSPEDLQERLEAEVLFVRGRILFGKGRLTKGESMLRRAFEVASEGGDECLAFDIRHTLFTTIWAQGRYVDAGKVAASLLDEARRDGRIDHLCVAKLAYSYFHLVEGDLSSAVRLTTEAVAHAREIGHFYREVDCLTLQGTARQLAGLYDQAHTSLEEARAVASRLRTAYHLANIAACQGRLSQDRGAVDEAVAYYEEAFQQSESLGDRRNMCHSLASRAMALCQRCQGEDLTRAVEAASSARDLAEDGLPPMVIEAWLAMAHVNRALGQLNEACANALTAVDAMEALGTHDSHEVECLLMAHDMLRATGKANEAREMIRTARLLVEERAGRISDELIRESYRQDVASHSRVEELWLSYQEA